MKVISEVAYTIAGAHWHWNSLIIHNDTMSLALAQNQQSLADETKR